MSTTRLLRLPKSQVLAPSNSCWASKQEKFLFTVDSNVIFFSYPGRNWIQRSHRKPNILTDTPIIAHLCGYSNPLNNKTCSKTCTQMLADFFTIALDLETSNVSFNKLWISQTIKCYSRLKEMSNWITKTMCVCGGGLKHAFWNKISQSKHVTYCMILTPLYSENAGRKDQSDWKLNRREVGNDGQINFRTHKILPYEIKGANISLTHLSKLDEHIMTESQHELWTLMINKDVSV